jgi:O-methyltransferase
MTHPRKHRILDRFLVALRKRLLRSSFRLSRGFSLLQDLLSKSYHQDVLDLAMQFVMMSEIPGDYLEFGVFEGDSFVTAFRLAKRYRLTRMMFYAFDSFAGLPDVADVDAIGHPGLSKGQLSSGGVERFKEMVSHRGVDLQRVVLVPGYFADSLHEGTKGTLSLRTAAIVYIDCDLYASTVPILNFIRDYIQDGTILIFDDWFLFKGHPDRGEQRAFREWLDVNRDIRVSEFHRFGWHGNSFIVHLG